MPLPTSKEELLGNLGMAYAKLVQELDAVHPAQERDPGLEGGISCCDLVAYQIGWADLLIGWEQEEASGQVPVMPAPSFKWNQLGDLAQSFYDRESTKDLLQLRAEFEARYDRLVAWISELSEPELFEPRQRQWTGDKWAMVKWIQINTIAPYRSARTKLRRWKKEKGI